MGKLFLVLSLFLISPAFAGTLPPILQILENTPQNLGDIERLVDFRWFDRAWTALEAYPSTDEEVVFLKAKTLYGLKKYDEALELFRSLIQTTSSPEIRRESILKEAMVLTRLKRYPEAIQIYEQLMERVPVKRMRTKLSWRAFKVALEAKDYEKGLKLLRSLSGPEVFWWRGWCLFRLEDYRGAVKNWELISMAQSLYWEGVAFEKLNEKSKAEKRWQELLEEYPTSFYGFLAVRDLPKEIPTEEGDLRWKWESDYPRPFKESIKKESKRRGLDPYLVFALIWQESRFQEEALSPAGAIGLMQLMPQTALMLAKASREKHFQLPTILETPMNIHLGCFYLKFLKRLFADQLPFVLASYNAGEEALARWLSLREGEPIEYFIEEIPFDETRTYVKKVLTAYWIYRGLYEGQPPPKF